MGSCNFHLAGKEIWLKGNLKVTKASGTGTTIAEMGWGRGINFKKSSGDGWGWEHKLWGRSGVEFRVRPRAHLYDEWQHISNRSTTLNERSLKLRNIVLEHCNAAKPAYKFQADRLLKRRRLRQRALLGFAFVTLRLTSWSRALTIANKISLIWTLLQVSITCNDK